MDNYTLQSYFKAVCKSWNIAYDEARKKEKEDENSNIHLMEDARILHFWRENYMSLNAMVQEILNTARSHNFKFIITSVEEVRVLASFFALKGDLDSYHIINMDDDALSVFPEDEMAQEFLRIYANEASGDIENFYKSYVQ